MKKLIILASFLAVAECSAQSLMDAPMSFSNSNFCRTYKCSSGGPNIQGDNGTTTWQYKTKNSNIDIIGITRKGSKANGQVLKVFIALGGGSKVFSSINQKIVLDLEKQTYGQIISKVPDGCYDVKMEDTHTPIPFMKFSYSNIPSIADCGILSNTLLISFYYNQ
ncbi:hypothetical protein Q0M94_06855 [Deinococcus radiomollis]|uniref:hypothetical protein n=1 Tax=Deinococcus radiomollis TaxID=468916 RepID=UPI0038913ED2